MGRAQLRLSALGTGMCRPLADTLIIIFPPKPSRQTWRLKHKQSSAKELFQPQFTGLFNSFMNSKKKEATGKGREAAADEKLMDTMKAKYAKSSRWISLKTK